jgi:hypothetical protein
MQVACDILLESSRRALQLCLRPHLDRRSAHKVMAFKVEGVPTLGISGLPFGSPKTKCHLDVGCMEMHKFYYKGEGGGFLQVQAVMSLVSLSLPMVCPSIKSGLAMH